MNWQLAGIVGVSPGSLTLRELVWMVDAHRREAWQHTSSILATFANIHRDPKKKPKPYSATDFQPTALSAPKPDVPKVEIRVLKRVFVDRS